MPATPESQAAYDALSAMDSQIRNAEANLRILRGVNSSSVPDLTNKLAQAKKQRDDFMRAIQGEHDNQG